MAMWKRSIPHSNPSLKLDGPRQVRWSSLCVLAFSLLTVLGAAGAPVAAQEASSLQVAQDGQRLDDQPFELRATFSAVWGDQAAARWIQERNLALAGGQTPSGPRIGFLHQGSPASPAVREAMAAFVRGLRAAGYSPGKDLLIDWRFAGGQLDRLPALADELVALSPSTVAAVTQEAMAVRQATSTIPIVMAQVTDPIGNGLVDSYEYPGGNVTGLTISGSYPPKLRLLKQTLPDAARVAVLVPNVTNGPTPAVVAEVVAAAPAFGLQVHVFELRSWDELTAAFATAAAEHADAVLLVGGAGDGVVFTPNWERIAALAVEGRVPVMYVNRQGVDAGGLMGYALAAPPIYEQAAGYVDRILHGARPEELPVMPATEAEFVINLKAAQAIGLSIPQAVLDQATEILR
jgi:putative tryptophan/tyrosine transport system substrate-binding protein